MPALDSTFVRTPTKTTITFATEQVQNVINSLMLLSRAERLSGLGEWISQTAATLPAERLQINRVVILGLHYVIRPTRRWSSFSAYLDDLENQDPDELRDRVFRAYGKICHTPKGSPQQMSPDEYMASRHTFLAFLKSNFPPEAIDEEIETEAYGLLKDPPAMKELVISHLRTMWNDLLAAEWERNLPMLKTSVEAFRQLDFSGMSHLEITQKIMGDTVMEKWRSLLEKDLDHIIFVPSAHLGPYQGVFKQDRVLWLLFGARLPEGTTVHSPDLSRSELLTRLNALADDTRLHILQALKDEGEQCSKHIMQQLELSQSATSRHLKQLSATGYLNERRKNGAKCYRLNMDRVEDTLEALSQFLLG